MKDHARRDLTTCLLLAFLAPAVAAGGLPAAEAGGFDHSDLDAVLAATVRGEGVDYPLLRERYGDLLDGYLARIASFDVSDLPRDERLALHINLYNAAVLQAVAERFESDYSVARDSFGLFDEPRVEVGGERISLNQLEHERIRPQFREPRIHVALVCAARSCPPLLPQAYTAENLEALLESNMRRFLDDPQRNRIDRQRRELRLSRIFEWYAEDFGGPEGLTRYVDGFVDADVAGFTVSFLDYSWELNLAEPR